MKSAKKNQRVILITGGGRGIGLAIAEAFLVNGDTVCIVDIADKAELIGAERTAKFGKQLSYLKIDLSKKGGAEKAVQRVVKMHGRIDVLVNNAKSGRRVSLLEETGDSWQKTMIVTLQAAFFSAQEAIRHMRIMGGGCIVNIGSVSGFLATQESPSYHIAKGGVIQLTRYLAVAAGEYGVRVNAVLPGFIVQDEDLSRFKSRSNKRFRSMAEASHPIGRVGDVHDVAASVMFLCSDSAKYISGECLTLDGAATKQETFNSLYFFSQRKRKHIKNGR
jgi:NAD(P)-dependent dehydrogenase (short-subunit alcohol dehydrogenase family)